MIMNGLVAQYKDKLSELACHGSGWIMLLAFVCSICYLGFQRCLAGSYVLSLFGAVTAYAALKGHDDGGSNRLSRVLAWLGLLVGGLCVHWNAFIGVSLSICLLSSIMWLSGWRLALRCLVPLFLMLVLAWKQEYLYMSLSFPMSRICAFAAGWLLKLLGVKVAVDMAMISIGDEMVAVTAACSGIELLEVVMLLGWFVVFRWKTSNWIRITEYLLLLPFVIICNTIRLVVVILLYLRYGVVAFQDPWHTLFGYLVLAAVLLLMLFVGWLLQGTTNGEAT